MSNKEFINNLSATYADVRRLDAKKINLKGKNILEYIEESVPTITYTKDTRETVYTDDLWGQWVETKDDGTVVIHDDYLSNPNVPSAWLSDVKAVQNNKVYSEITTDDEGNFTGVDESSVVANIQTEMIKDGTRMFWETPLTSFSGDLSSLVTGFWMFADCDYLTSFSGDLSSLVNGYYMFYYTQLTSFSGDLSSLVNGDYMFWETPLTSFSGDLSNLANGNSMFYHTVLESFSGDLSNLANGKGMFDSTSLKKFNEDLSSLVNGDNMFNFVPLESFSGDLSSLVNGSNMFCFNHNLTSFTSDLSSLVNGYWMFNECKLSSQSVMCIVNSIRNITEEKAKYESGEIPWVTYDSTTQKYSAPFGYMEDGKYVYTYDNPNPYNISDIFTTTISSVNVGRFTLGIDVTNNADTISDQLQTFAEECLYESWDKLKETFSNKGWTVTFQYGGSDSSIALSEDEQFRGVPVYARLIEVSEEDKDRAEYYTEDGTKFYNIDWGHDVTDYDQYQYFGSLLEACGYYGVIPKKYLEV